MWTLNIVELQVVSLLQESDIITFFLSFSFITPLAAYIIKYSFKSFYFNSSHNSKGLEKHDSAFLKSLPLLFLLCHHQQQWNNGNKDPWCSSIHA